MVEEEWTYINEYRRYNGDTHQLYIEGKWENINLINKDANKIKIRR